MGMLEVNRIALVALATAGGLTQGLPQPGSQLIFHAVRAYRPDQGRTEVNAFVQVPYTLLEPTSDLEDARLSYTVAVKVTDSTGLTLLQQSWQNHASARARQPGASAVDMVRFSLAPGRYRVAVSVEDSVSGRRNESALDLEGYRTSPPASDLLLSPQIRSATASDTVPGTAELRWGGMLVTAAARLELTPLRPEAFYLLEAYAARQDSGTMNLKVTDSTGRVMVKTPTTKVQVPAGGGVLKGRLDLAGLPPGGYTITATLAVGGTSVDRSATFGMAGLDETLEKDVARREAAKVTDEGYFEAMTGPQLDAAKEPLDLIAASGELSSYNKDVSVRGRRRFLADFWRRRDPTPNTPANEARQLFYEGVNYADKAYGDRGRVGTPGWRSDRGRIYVRNGKPDETLTRPSEQRASAYEVWHYTSRGKDRYYIFVDRFGGVGSYQLVHSNDIKEPGRPDWKESLHKVDALVDISRFLGIDFVQLTNNEYR
jgi:GWxTD domain-containing protein